MSTQEMTRSLRSVTKQYVLPAEHGGWFLWIGPFLLGAVAAGRFAFDLIWLALLILAVYLSRQPLIIIVKALSGRRGRADIGPASRALAVILITDALLLGILLLHGDWYLIAVGIPAIPVLALQMWLVSRRKERQIGIELIGSGVLALAATAAYWVSLGTSDPRGWWLWGLAWLYNASAIVYVYLRLQQRRWSAVPAVDARWGAGRNALLVAATVLVAMLGLAFAGLVPPLTPVAYALALAHYSYGMVIPCVKARPVRVGIEQSAATLAFFIILALTFRV